MSTIIQLKDWPILYKRTKTGAIVFWAIEAKDGTIWKRSGQIGTPSPILHTEICEGKNIGKKNETSREEQAELQAESDWNRKRDEGYKSLKDLNQLVVGPTMEAYWGKPETRKIYDDIVLPILENVLPQFNTDANGNIKPMLAPTKPWKAGDKKNKYPRQMETKFDGVRAMLRLERKGPDVVATMLSRSGKEYTTVAHIINAVLESQLDVGDPIILDGEIYKHGWTLQEINRAIKKHRPGITEQLEFWIYDMPLLDAPQAVRSLQVHSIVLQIDSPNVKIVSFAEVNSDEEVQKYHDEWVKDGYEGGILKDPNGVYQQGQRSSYWTKVKMFDETEFEIIGYKLGQRGVEDLIFVCEVKDQITNDVVGTVDVKMKGSRESKEELFKEIDQITQRKPLTVKHFGYTEYSIPFLPVGKAIRDYE